TISLNITNAGDMDGKEVIQVYVKKKGQGAYRPEKELKAFEKVFVKVKECRMLKITLDGNAFRYFDKDKNSWQIDGSDYEIIITDGAGQIVQKPVTVQGEAISKDHSAELSSYYDLSKGFVFDKDQFAIVYGKPLPKERNKKEPFTRNSMLFETRERWVGRLVDWLVNLWIRRGKRKNDDFAKIAGKVLPMSPIRSVLTMSSDFDMDMADCLVEMFNGHVLRGLIHLSKERKRKKHEELSGN
ncbi:MAG TPA: fibronectin type III-like domain-contianing protein, partial [Candidatus Izemoplasmatales bacterium]|nr:fibronectin type III-like domain-contianing protein [Candidatus Izemoplasmatales bacterium]